jgi:hypothetical protein
MNEEPIDEFYADLHRRLKFNCLLAIALLVVGLVVYAIINTF